MSLFNQIQVGEPRGKTHSETRCAALLIRRKSLHAQQFLPETQQDTSRVRAYRLMAASMRRQEKSIFQSCKWLAMPA